MTITEGVQRVVQSLYDDYGVVEATRLVDAARPDESPAHNGFEWDDSLAGEQYRLMQARNWIKRVTVIYDDEACKLIHVPAVKVEEAQSNEGYYRPISEVVKVVTDFERALGQAVARFDTAKRALDDLRIAAERENRDADVLMIRQITEAADKLVHSLSELH